MSILHIAFYPSDWLAGTRGLSDAETGVYITLIAKMYEMAGPIERDDRRLARLCGCKTKNSFAKALDYLISEGKIIQTDDGLFNDRVQKEIKNATEKSDKAKAAAQSRWERKPNKNNGGSNANASAKHMPQWCQLEPEPEDNNSEDKSSSLLSRDDYDEFLKASPRARDTKLGRSAWASAIEAGHDPKALVASMRRYAADAKGFDPDKVKYADNWLRDQAWEKYPPLPVADPVDKLSFYAAWVNGDKHLPTGAISQSIVNEMIREGLVTPERAKERGLAA